MSSSNNKELISKASPHTIRKFELIEEYIKAWSQKLMLNKHCNGIMFIDCMCNSGLYHDEKGDVLTGTPIRVATALRKVADQYPSKKVVLCFNDIDKRKTDLLQENIPSNTGNYRIVIKHEDGNDLLKQIGCQLDSTKHLHYFLLYDPYDASIDWEALFPFFRNWGEVLINHMVSDPVRAITQVKKESKKVKYESTYLDAFENLVPFGSDKNAYEKRVEKIIKSMKGTRQYFIAAFPFYNTQNSQVYSLIHCTGNIVGFRLYKTTAWKTFGDKSSTKNSHVDNRQLTFDFEDQGKVTTETDESCYVVADIAKYLYKVFSGKENVPLQKLWDQLDYHPVFPSEGYRNEIKSDLEKLFGVVFTQKVNSLSGRKETVASFFKGTPNYEKG